MAQTITDKTNVTEYQKVREYLRQHKTLFGLIRWYRVVRTDVLREELYVKVEKLPPYIIVNTTKYVPEQPSNTTGKEK